MLLHSSLKDNAQLPPEEFWKGTRFSLPLSNNYGVFELVPDIQLYDDYYLRGM